MTIILFVLVLAVLILAHELGHFLVAKWGKIRVDEFGLGLPPRIWGFKKGETIYSLNWLPFGGFVKIFGEDPTEEDICGPDRARCFVNRPRKIQALVLLAGVTANILLTWLLISFNLSLGLPVATTGLPKGLTTQNNALMVVSVLDNSPAKEAGLKAGDRLLSLQSEKGRETNLTAESVKAFVQNHAGQRIAVDYRRASTTNSVSIIPKKSLSGGNAVIGISMEKIGLVKVAWWQAPYYGLYFTYNLTKSTLFGLQYFFTTLFTNGREALSSVAGPVGMYGLVGDASRLGLVYIFNFMAIISINLAVLNLLPFPALDGGRLLFVAIEAVTRRPIKPVIANTLNLIGFSLLILLMIVIAISDILKLF